VDETERNLGVSFLYAGQSFPDVKDAVRKDWGETDSQTHKTESVISAKEKMPEKDIKR